MKLKKVLCAIGVMLASGFAFSQEIQESKFLAGFNVDGAVYSTTSYHKTLHTTDEDGAAGSITSIWGEYMIIKGLSAGIKVGRVKYIVEKDSVTNVQPVAGSFDYGVFVNYHIINKKKFSLPVGITFGGSSFKLDWKDNAHSQATANGFFMNIGINPRLYFGNGRFGMNFKLAYATYTYNSVDFKDDFSVDNDVISYKGKGVNIGVGFQARIK